MKRVFACWLIGIMICASMARAGDVKITVITSAGEKGKPTTVFTPDTPELFAAFKITGAKKGDELGAAWFADDVGDAAPANTKIAEKAGTVEGAFDGSTFS